MSKRVEMISLTDLAESVLEKSREGKLTWTELSPGSFHTKIGEEFIIIEREGVLPRMKIANQQGVELEKIRSASTAVRDHQILSEIYEVARRQALRVDETLINIKRALDSL